jgi:hypothetical protein
MAATAKQRITAELAFIDHHVEQVQQFDYDAIDRGNPLVAEITEATESRALSTVKLFTRAISDIYYSHNSKQSALCFLIATGDHAAQGRKIKSAAREFGVSKQAISKCCVEWCELMGVPPSDYMRKESENYAKSNHRNKKQ